MRAGPSILFSRLVAAGTPPPIGDGEVLVELKTQD
jgi:hypothetical protein